MITDVIPYPRVLPVCPDRRSSSTLTTEGAFAAASHGSIRHQSDLVVRAS